MITNSRRLWMEINLDNLDYNVKGIKKLLNKDVEYISVVKGNGYGHGAIEVAKVCIENGIKWLAVAIFEEALELRRAGINNPILILGHTSCNKAYSIIANDLSQMCFSYECAKNLSDAAVRMDKIAKIHIKIETGMTRLGFMPNEENAEMVRKISMLPNVKIEGIYTHLATSYEKDKTFVYEQYKRYMEFLDMLKNKGVAIGMRHIANSGAVIDLPDFYMDAVRVGAIQYGSYPSDEVQKSRLDLKPVMSVKTNIISIMEVNEETPISYGRTYYTKRKSKIATIPIGYADGYPRRLQGKAKVIINGKYAPVVGTICMDLCMVDVTDIVDAKVGDEVIIMGSDGTISMPVNYLAPALDTADGEIFCMFSRRVPRVYIKNGKIVKVEDYLK